MRPLTLLFLAAVVGGCHGLTIHGGSVSDRTADAPEMYAKFQDAVREGNVAQQFHYYSKTFQKRYPMLEYGMMVNGDATIGGLFKRFVLDWRVVEIGYAKDHKSGWILLEHPTYPQYRKVLDLVSEHDEKLNCDQWRIDFGCAKWMGLPDSLEVKLIADEEEWRQKVNKSATGSGGPPKEPPKEEPKDEPKEEPKDAPKEGHHD